VKKFVPVVEVVASTIRRDESSVPKTVRITEIISMDSPAVEEYHGHNVPSPSSPNLSTDVSVRRQKFTDLGTPKEWDEREEGMGKEEHVEFDIMEDGVGESVGKFQEITPKRKKRRRKRVI
jgi:hypothetical protein